jgi:hypothetical protein
MTHIYFSIWFSGLVIINSLYAYASWLDGLGLFWFNLLTAVYCAGFSYFAFTRPKRMRNRYENIIRMIGDTDRFIFENRAIRRPPKTHNWIREGF